MPDQPEVELSQGDVERVEALLRELSTDDTELTEPPADLWGRIEVSVGAEDSTVVSLDRRRRFSGTALLGAAAAAVLLVAGGIGLLATRGDDASVVANAELSYDAANFDSLGANATAAVSLVDDGKGFQVDIESAVLPTPTGEEADLELWLIRPDADGNPQELVSLGLIDPDDPGDFDVPADYDPSDFFVVDISVEPRDGDETHSGRSILRGALTEV